MNRRDALKVMAAVAALPRVASAACDRPVGFFEFYSGSGDEEVVAAYSKEQAIEFMRSLVVPPDPNSPHPYERYLVEKYEEGFRPEAVTEICGTNLMHGSETTEDHPEGLLVTLDEQHRRNLADGCEVPYLICSMNV